MNVAVWNILRTPGTVTYSSHESSEHYAEWKESDTKSIHLYEIPEQTYLQGEKHISGPQRPGYREEEIHVNGSGVFGALQKFSTSSLWWYAFAKTHWTVHLPLVNSILWKSDLNRSEFLKSTCDLDLSPWAMWKHISWELPFSFCPHKASVLSSCLVGWSVYSGKPNALSTLLNFGKLNALSTLLNHVWLWTVNSRPQFYQMVKVKKKFYYHLGLWSSTVNKHINKVQ